MRSCLDQPYFSCSIPISRTAQCGISNSNSRSDVLVSKDKFNLTISLHRVQSIELVGLAEVCCRSIDGPFLVHHGLCNIQRCTINLLDELGTPLHLKSLSDSIIVDLDRNQVHVPESCDIPCFPSK